MSCEHEVVSTETIETTEVFTELVSQSLWPMALIAGAMGGLVVLLAFFIIGTVLA